MERKIVWTERASADIEAIVRYLKRRDPAARAESDSESTIGSKYFFSTRRQVQ
jgi:plasmid stabilization system protein ParE